MIEAVCLRTLMPLRAISPHAKITRVPPLECKRLDSAYIVRPTKGYSLAFHNSCLCNELISLHNRHLIDRTHIGFDARYWHKASTYVLSRWKFSALTPQSYTDVVSGYSGKKKRIYNRAKWSLLEHGLRPTDHHVKMFIKPDRYASGQIEDKAPRAIQYRNPRYNLELARFLRPLEHAVYTADGWGPSALPQIAKGMNNRMRARVLLEKAACFDSPVFYSTDHSKFDSCVTAEMLRTLDQFYLRVYARHRGLRNILKLRRKTKCFTRHGIRYTVIGTRMSGDYDTGLGNSIINVIVLCTWCEYAGVKYELLLDGDDGVVIVEKRDMHKLDPDHFSRLGFETKISWTDDISHVDFCQSRLVLATEPTMCRNPIRALSNMAVCFRNYSRNAYFKWYCAVASCEYATNKRMPIFHVFERFIDAPRIEDDDFARKMEGETFDPGIGGIARAAFAHTWGINDTQQRLIEDSLGVYCGYLFEYTNRIHRILLGHDIGSTPPRPIRHATISGRFYSLGSTIDEGWSSIGAECI